MGFTEVFVLVSVMIYYCTWVFYNTEFQWSPMDMDTLASTQIPRFVSPHALAYFRLTAASIIWGTILFIIFDPVGFPLVALDKNESEKIVMLHGLSRLTTFTVWSWMLQGFYFALATFCSFVKLYPALLPSTMHSTCSDYLSPVAFILFEISFPVAFLVSGVVTFVLIPFERKNNPTTFEGYFYLHNLLMHNANVLFMAIEFFVNDLHFTFHHYVYMLVYGLCYIVFSWGWKKYFNILYYFFLDYQRKDALFWHIGLLSGILALFFAGYYLSNLQFEENAFFSVMVSELSFVCWLIV
jgi:hypothetical protein